MADNNELVSAILAAGMLPPLPPPTIALDGGIGEHDRARLTLSILHAVGLYRGILEALAAKGASSATAKFRPDGNRHCQLPDASAGGAYRQRRRR
jgi:hypothetical protein